MPPMPKLSAGILLFRRISGNLEVFLVHPGGPLWAHKDLGAWSIPKGECGVDEEAFSAARREFAEETGSEIDGDFISLTPVRQSAVKTVHAWAVEGDLDAAAIRSNTFTMQWPVKSGRYQAFPEVDRGEWFAITQARKKMIKGQLPLLDELIELLKHR
jgi:predicted NUDIX family NTP pyrophosphohydrolase